MKTNLIQAADLHAQLNDSDIRIVDASWYMPGEHIDCRKQFEEQHIPGAVFFDIDIICDQSNDLPHMLPSASLFAEAVGGLGISSDEKIVVYDSAGLFSAARAWWMFQVFGHANVGILNGGLPAWLALGYEVDNGVADPKKAEFNAELNTELVVKKSQMIANIESAQCSVLDARSLARFEGTAPEPRPGLPSGHMPNAKCLPFNDLIEQGQLRPREQLVRIFDSLDVSSDTRVITTCGSGVTAAIISLALHEVGYGLHSLYDGAWVEWASSNDTTVLSG